MPESSREPGRTPTRLVLAAVGLIFLILLGVIVFRGCHEGGLGEDEVRPDSPLPGTEEATTYRAVPDAAPLLRAA